MTYPRSSLLLAVLTLVLTGTLSTGCSHRSLSSADLDTAGEPAARTVAPATTRSTADVLAAIESQPLPPGVKPELFAAMKAALAESIAMHHGNRITSAPPLGAGGYVSDIGVSNGLLHWTYENRGDYNLDSMVTVSDLTAVGQHYEASATDDDWLAARPADGNRDGMVTVSDITPIGQYYEVNCSGYTVFTAADPAGALTELGEILFDAALEYSRPPYFEFTIPAEVQAWLMVRPFDSAGSPGELSRAVPSGGGGAQRYLVGPDDAPHVDYIPDLPVLMPGADNFDWDTSPDGSGLMTSRTRINLVLMPGTTVQEANQLLAMTGAAVAGSVPGLNMLVAEIPDSGGFTGLHDALDLLGQSPLVMVAVEDTLLGPTVLNHPSRANDPTLSPSSHPGQQDPNYWKWDLPPSESTNLNGNWGMEAIRAPQAWNLRTYGRRMPAPPRVMVFDLGFNDAHPDGEMSNLALYHYDTTAVVPGHEKHYHGMHITGTVGGEHFNNTGVAGINPLLSWVTSSSERFVGFTMREAMFNTYNPYDSRQTAFSTVIADVYQALDHWASIQAMNLSLGYNWYRGGPGPIFANTDPDAQAVCRGHGMIFRFFAAMFPDTIFVCAAGNDSKNSNGFAAEMEARWSSPFNWAALDPALAFTSVFNIGPVPNVVVVESVDAVVDDTTGPATAWEYFKDDMSNMGGHVAAPGSHILSCVGNNFTVGYTTPENYESLSGTSMASPHVTGLLNYLGTLDPSLTQAELISLATADQYTRSIVLDPDDITPAAVTVPNDGMIDVFAAVTGIDTIQGNRHMQQALVDVDDGTRDGNLRTRVLNNAGHISPADPSPDTIHSSDLRRGDADTTMKDFRVFRDAYVTAHHSDFPLALSLDGASNHFKKDLNFDGTVWTGGTMGTAVSPSHPVDIPNATELSRVVPENHYPRYDFNGDGEVGDWATTAPYRNDPELAGGIDESFAAISAPGFLRDVDVLMTSGNWQQRDFIYEELGVPAYWENNSVTAADEGTAIANHWGPRRFLLGNRDATAAVDAAFQRTPDYLHSADIHFWIDWPHLALQYSWLDITVTSEIDGVLPPFTRTARFYPSDPRKFVLTMPVWDGSIAVDWQTSGSLHGDNLLPASLGADIPYGITNVVTFPERHWEIYNVWWRLEPVFWIRDFGPQEGYVQRTVMAGNWEEGIGSQLKYMQAYDDEDFGEPLPIATLPYPTLMAGGDLYGSPAVVSDDGEHGLLFFISDDGGHNWQQRLLDSGPDYHGGQLAIAQHGGDMFVLYSRSTGGGPDKLAYVRNQDGWALDFSAPAEICEGISPSAKEISGELMAGVLTPGDPAGDFLQLYVWDAVGETWQRDMDVLLPLMPAEPEQITFELFDHEGWPAFMLQADGQLYFLSDSAGGWYLTDIATVPGGFEWKPWIRPQAMRFEDRIGCFFHGSYWLADDTSGIGWQPAGHEYAVPGFETNPEHMRAVSIPQVFSVQFAEPAHGSMVINSQDLLMH